MPPTEFPVAGEYLSVHGGPDAEGTVPHDFSTNANSCGPCPSALEAIRAADAGGYPDPAYTALRRGLAAFHQVDPARSLLAGLPGTALIEQGFPDLAKRDFFIHPPPNTRANLRSEAMRTILHKRLSYVIDWDLIYIGEGKQIHLDDPFVHDLRTLSSFRGPEHR